MTTTATKCLYIKLDKNSGFCLLDQSLKIQTIQLNSFLIRFKTGTFYGTLPRPNIYLRMSGLAGSVLSNLGNVNGLPLLYEIESNSSLWTPELSITLSQKLTQRIDFEVIDENNELIDFSDIDTFELVFQVST